jgi:hypothetical protein
MRLDKLARQLRAHQNATRKQTDTGQRQLRDQIADLDRRIGLQINALERGIEPDLIGQRNAGLRDAKSTLRRRARPRCSCASRNLALALQRAPPGINGQVVDAFGRQLTYDKTARRIEISATITEGHR